MGRRRETHIALPTRAEVQMVATLVFGSITVSGLAVLYALVVFR